MSVKNETLPSVENPVPAYDPGLASDDDVAVLGMMTQDGPRSYMRD